MTTTNDINNFDIIVVTHRIFTEGKRKRGGLDKVIDFFAEKNKKILLIEHPLKALKESRDQKWNSAIITAVSKNKTQELEKIKMKNYPALLYWIAEIIFNIAYISKKINNQKLKPILFSSDPLNNLTGIILSGKFRKKYFHCVDYSKKRFNNFLLNYIYCAILKKSFKYFDYLSVNSLRTKKEFIKLGCPDDKIIYIPNSPAFAEIDISDKELNTIIYTGGAVIDKYNYEAVIEILSKIKKYYPKVKLYALGGITQDKKYLNKIKKMVSYYNLENNICFTGFLSFLKLSKLLEKSSIGFSFYSKKTSYYNYFGDSQKIRGYALYGIPTISDGESATDQEMAKETCGFIVKNIDEAVEKIKLLWSNKEIYAVYQQNCLRWARKMDKNKFLKVLFNRIIS